MTTLIACCACIEPTDAAWHYTGQAFDGDFLCARHAQLIRNGVDNNPDHWERLPEVWPQTTEQAFDYLEAHDLAKLRSAARSLRR